MGIAGLGTAMGSLWTLASWICISSPWLAVCVTLNYSLVLVNVVSFMDWKERAGISPRSSGVWGEVAYRQCATISVVLSKYFCVAQASSTLLWRNRWPWTPDPSAPLFLAQGLQVCASKTSLCGVGAQSQGMCALRQRSRDWAPPHPHLISYHLIPCIFISSLWWWGRVGRARSWGPGEVID